MFDRLRNQQLIGETVFFLWSTDLHMHACMVDVFRRSSKKLVHRLEMHIMIMDDGCNETTMIISNYKLPLTLIYRYTIYNKRIITVNSGKLQMI